MTQTVTEVRGDRTARCRMSAADDERAEYYCEAARIERARSRLRPDPNTGFFDVAVENGVAEDDEELQEWKS